MEFRLGINTGFAVNRYSEPEEWTKIVGHDLGLHHVQLTADLLNPDLPAAVLTDHVKRIREGCGRHDVNIQSTFTGAFTRVNHFAHPDAAVRAHWLGWFKRFVDLSVDLGAEALGSHFGIFTARDNGDEKRRGDRRAQNIECWHQLAQYAKEKGLKYLSWEPMSIKREQGETLKEARRLHDDVNRHSPLPIYMCLDVDHGDLASPNPEDINPYAWLSTFAGVSPQIHLKQASKNKGGHWPFIEKHNAEGLIRPEKVLETLRAARAPFDKVYLFLELSFKEREPTDSTVVPVLKESVQYWRPHIPR